jgi:two-component system sensor histidine kinase BaeS
VAVAAVVLTALVTVGLARLGAPDRALRELDVEAERVASVAAGLPCEGQTPRAARALGPRARFVPDDAPRARLTQLRGPTGRTVFGGREALYASRRTTLCGHAGTLYVFRLAREVPTLPEGFTSRLLFAALVALGGSAVVAYGLARRMSRPLGDLARSARAVARGDATGVTPPTPSDPSEVAELKDAFGGMIADLDVAREREKAFLLSVSHELRTPLTAIRGYGEALVDGTARRSKKAGEVVVRESKRLERLVQDLLDLGRLEAGEFSVEMTSADLGDVAASVVEALRPAAKEAGVRLMARDDGTSVVQTDPDRVHQMVANLVENAMRVTPDGERVEVAVHDRTIAVSDAGPGLEPEDAQHAFERFYLWRKYRGERSVGSGLGLAIVHELAERLGVRVEVHSDGASGTRFELHFDA